MQLKSLIVVILQYLDILIKVHYYRKNGFYLPHKFYLVVNSLYKLANDPWAVPAFFTNPKGTGIKKTATTLEGLLLALLRSMRLKLNYLSRIPIGNYQLYNQLTSLSCAEIDQYLTSLKFLNFIYINKSYILYNYLLIFIQNIIKGNLSI